jgi:hypothetical protein
MLTLISDEVAIDLDKIDFMERDGDGWRVCMGEREYTLVNFEALRILEILGQKVTNEMRYKCDGG